MDQENEVEGCGEIDQQLIKNTDCPLRDPGFNFWNQLGR